MKRITISILCAIAFFLGVILASCASSGSTTAAPLPSAQAINVTIEAATIPSAPSIAPTEPAFTGKSPWWLTRTECLAPDFGDLGPAFYQKTFSYFQSMWREAGLIPNPEPTANNEILSLNTPTFMINFGGDYAFFPPCTWIALASKNANQYYLLFRLKDNSLRKYLLNNDSILDIMVGNWVEKDINRPDYEADLSVERNCGNGSYCINISRVDLHSKIGPFPLFYVRTKNACFGTQWTDFECLDYEWMFNPVTKNYDEALLLQGTGFGIPGWSDEGEFNRK
jgi:hypothetical protein